MVPPAYIMMCVEESDALSRLVAHFLALAPDSQKRTAEARNCANQMAVVFSELTLEGGFGGRTPRLYL